jgi:hypothetical protein
MIDVIQAWLIVKRGSFKVAFAQDNLVAFFLILMIYASNQS